MNANGPTDTPKIQGSRAYNRQIDGQWDRWMYELTGQAEEMTS